MICKYCKNEFEDAAACPHCGRPQKKKRVFAILSNIPARYWLCIGVLIVAFLVAAAVFTYGLRPDPYARTSATISTIYDGEQTSFYYNSKHIEGTFDGRVASPELSLSGGVMAFLSDSKLYLVDKKGLRIVSQSVTHFQLAPSGGSIAYINSVGELYRYTRSSKKSVLIDYNVLASNLCIAHDGTLAYLKQETDADTMYYCVGKKTHKYPIAGRYPLAVSEGAGRLYVTDGSANLYCSNGKKETRIGQAVSDCVYFDDDFFEVLFYSNGATYLYSGKGEAHRISQSEASPVLANNTGTYISRIALSDDLRYGCYDVRSFARKYFIDANGVLVRVDGKYGVSELESGVDDARVTANGRWVYYLHGGVLTGKREGAKSSDVAKGVARFTMSADGRYLYYTDDAHTLYAKHGRLKASQVASEVSDFWISAPNYVFYLSTDGLSVVRGSARAKHVIAEPDIYSIEPHAAYYIDDGKLYMSKGNAKFAEKQTTLSAQAK